MPPLVGFGLQWAGVADHPRPLSLRANGRTQEPETGLDAPGRAPCCQQPPIAATWAQRERMLQMPTIVTAFEIA